MIKKIYILGMATMAMCGCENDIDLPTDNALGILCINGYINAGDSVHTISVSLTGYNEPQVAHNAKVMLYVNGSLTSEGIVYSGGEHGLYSLYDSEVELYGIINPGDRVQVVATYNGQTAQSDGIVPQPPQNVTATGKFVDYYIDNEGHRNIDNNAICLNISMTDDGSQANYYRLACGYSDSIVMPTIQVEEQDEYTKTIQQYHFLYSWNYISVSPYREDEEDDELKSYYYETKIGWTSTEFYYYDVPALTDEESNMKIEDLDFIMPNIENKYRIMSDKRFSGSTLLLTTYVKTYDLKSKYVAYGSRYNLTDEQIQSLAPILYAKGVVRLTAIDADQYYYIKVLNAIESDYYSDYSELTGSVKIPSNVSGGSGNIFLTASTDIEVSILEDYQSELEVENYGYYY